MTVEYRRPDRALAVRVRICRESILTAVSIPRPWSEAPAAYLGGPAYPGEGYGVSRGAWPLWRGMGWNPMFNACESL
ncbi:MAG: hypothetical protein FWG14_00425 [Peptococcaceae bacterium]|nr:hypothetical protein [Peptococcaceae bacterium]